MTKRRHVLVLYVIVFGLPCVWLVNYSGMLQVDTSQGGVVRQKQAMEASVNRMQEVAQLRAQVKHQEKQQTANTSNHSVPTNSTKNTRPLLILHLGPPKTGTTTIQYIAGTFASILRQDNIHYVGYFWGKQHPELNTHEIGYACRQKNKQLCRKRWNQLHQTLNRHHQQGHNVFLSEEIFSDFAPHVEQEYLMQYIQPMLQKWNVQIIFAYRRFYEWAPSWYTQKYQPTPGHKTLLQWPGTRSKEGIKGIVIPTIREWFDKEASYRYHQLLTNPTKWQSALTVQDRVPTVSIFNMHQKNYATNKGQMEKDFFCQKLPQATTFCNFMQQQVATELKNPSSSKHLHYDLLTMEAYNRGWLNDKKTNDTQPTIATRHKTRVAVEEYTTQQLGLTKMTDFAHLDCLSKNQTQILLDWSLELSSRLVPNYFESRQLKAEFETSVQQDKFCSIDARKTLNQKDREWKRFFQSLKETN